MVASLIYLLLIIELHLSLAYAVCETVATPQG